MVLACTLPMQAFALQTSAPGCASKGPILSGLWAGVNAATGAHYDCEDASTSEQGSGSDQMNSSGIYVALGDSVAAGLGLPLATSSNTLCGVSDEAYASTVAAALDMDYYNAACSGATMGDLFTEQHPSGTSQDIQPQLDSAFAAGTPALVTITAGANDVRWADFIRKCYVATCGTKTDDAVAAGLLTALRVKLAYALHDIQVRSGGYPPTVVLTGYYQPFSEACTAASNGLTTTEIQWIRTQTDRLNQTLARAAAKHSFVRYASPDFSGHELCTADPWIQGPADVAPLHPTAAGQQAIAAAVLAKLQ